MENTSGKNVKITPIQEQVARRLLVRQQAERELKELDREQGSIAHTVQSCADYMDRRAQLLIKMAYSEGYQEGVNLVCGIVDVPLENYCVELSESEPGKVLVPTKESIEAGIDEAVKALQDKSHRPPPTNHPPPCANPLRSPLR